MLCNLGDWHIPDYENPRAAFHKFLQSVHSCLGELFTFIDEENKRLGYIFAKVVEIPKARVEGPVESFYPKPAKLSLGRSLNTIINRF
ncbi:hypothetical protein BDD43_2613 [Mucilaginibacter gracilis]|uniref:Uncharacterized protein n=1 Tax=Mucilaginibacter gracilis TaxID=423350 RepID=A0A495J112_9SPHI|nr:hypothetical protein [Mucilaginibacter gracilis]RKR82433.1 hypothetical protein BDD43_2613 [Mucilaginibacter gracilis]